MIISLIGYMGSGKSHISKNLSEKINLQVFDLDHEISLNFGKTIPEIFSEKGEIFFRKEEKKILEEFLNKKNQDFILSLGGGTPVYYNNIESINALSESIYLRSSVSILTERLLLQKENRPLIANLDDEALPEFIAKHLFERNVFYAQAKHVIDTDHKTPDAISEEIINLLQLRHLPEK